LGPQADRERSPRDTSRSTGLEVQLHLDILQEMAGREMSG
jgi:hypothetical protein